MAYTSDELTALIQGVADNLIDAGIHYRLYRDLVAEIPVNGTLLNEARAFWTLTFVGHRDAAVFRLCRVYDQEPRALGFQTLLKAMRDNLPLFDEAPFRQRLKGNRFINDLAKLPRVPRREDIDADLAATGAKDPLVRQLVILRNNVFAHTSPGYAMKPERFAREMALEEKDIWALVDRGLEIINRYAQQFMATSYAKTIVGHDDYKSVLDALRRDASERERQIYEELKAAGALDLEGNFEPPAS